MGKRVYYNRVRETATAPGTTLNVSLAGAQTGRVSLGSRPDLAVGDVFDYVLENPDTDAWEIGLGTWKGSNSFDRTIVYENSSGTTARLNFTTDTDFWLDHPAQGVLDAYGSIKGAVDQIIATDANVLDVVVYDTSNDSDNGAWRGKCQHTSWYNELGEYPRIVGVVIRATTIDYVDLTQAHLPVYAQFTAQANGALVRSADNTGVQFCARIADGKMVVGSSGGGASNGLYIVDFINDSVVMYRSADGPHRFNGDISDRNTTVSWSALGGSATISDNNVLDVAITTLSTAETDAHGHGCVTIACAHDGGVSVVNPAGTLSGVYTVIDITISVAFYNYGKNVEFMADDRLWLTVAYQGNQDDSFNYLISVPTVDTELSNNISPAGGAYYSRTTYADMQIISDNNLPAGITYKGFAATSDGLAIGGGNGLTQIIENSSDYGSGLVAYTSKDYTTGWMHGGIIAAWLANNVTADYGPAAHTLTENGTITESSVATSAELKAYSGFSTSNYLELAYDSAFDVGTGDFSIALWWKATNCNNTNTLFNRGYWNGSAWSGAVIALNSGISGTPEFKITDDGYATQDSVTFADLDNGVWHLLCAVRESGNLKLYADGILVGTTAITNAAGSLNNANATVMIGDDQRHTVGAADESSIALVRFAAGALSAQQVAKMYADERPMFLPNAKCLLGGTSNAIQSLCYDAKTRKLDVPTADGASEFVGLVRVAYHDSTETTLTSDTIRAVARFDDRMLIASAAEYTFRAPARGL